MLTLVYEGLRSDRVVAGLVAMLACAFSVPVQAADSWRQHVIDHSLDGADGVRLADVDGDGDEDIAVAWEQSGRSRLYLNPGRDNMAAHGWPFIDTGKIPGVEDALPADVDGDGSMDVISAGSGTAGWRSRGPVLSVHFAPAGEGYQDSNRWITASFPALSGGNPAWMFSVVADVNGDGQIDIVSGSRSVEGGVPAMVGWFEAPATDRRDLRRWRFHRIGDAGWIMSLISRDMDGDGDVDVVVSDRKIGPAGDLRGVRWLENPGGPVVGGASWNNHWIGAREREVMFVAMADLDGDRDADMVVPSIGPDRITWYERVSPEGDTWSEHEIDYPRGLGRPKAVAVSDINCDGMPDLVISCEAADAPKSGVAWLENIFGGGVGHRGLMHPVSGPVATDRQPWLQKIFGRPERFGPAGIKFDRIEITDLDGDGDPDILTTEENQGRKSRGLGVVWYQNPRHGCPPP